MVGLPPINTRRASTRSSPSHKDVIGTPPVSVTSNVGPGGSEFITCDWTVPLMFC